MLSQYSNTSYAVLSPGIQKFCQKINMSKGNYQFLRIGVVASCQSIVLENKVIQKLCYQKMSLTENVPLN